MSWKNGTRSTIRGANSQMTKPLLVVVLAMGIACGHTVQQTTACDTSYRPSGWAGELVLRHETAWLDNDAIWVGCEISDTYATYHNSSIWLVGSEGYTTHYCSLVYDMDSTASEFNGGYWSFELANSMIATYIDPPSRHNGTRVPLQTCVTKRAP